MTCIAGIETPEGVWIGGDSAGVSGLNLTIRADEKVFKRNTFAFGFTSSFRMGQLLRYKLKLPKTIPTAFVNRPDAWMASQFIDSVRLCLKDGGFAKVENGVEAGGIFLVGWNRYLWVVHSDFQVARPSEGIAAVGCGSNLALGALEALKLTGWEDKQPEEQVRIALAATARFSAWVAPPFRVISTKEEE